MTLEGASRSVLGIDEKYLTTTHQRRCFVSGLALLWLVCLHAAAEQLPLKVYTVTDGLVYNHVKRIYADQRGFLWLATSGGLSRFDGRHFVNYGSDDGLSYRSINDLLETRQGVFWVATNGGGVNRFNPDANANSRFTPYRVGGTPAASRVNVLFEDHAGTLWAGTDGGLFRLDAGATAFQPVALGLAGREERLIQVWSMAEGRAGNLWIGTSLGLVQRAPDGRMTQHAIQTTAGRDTVWALLLDDVGCLWLGHQTAGLRVYRVRNAEFRVRLEEDTDIPHSALRASHLSDVRTLCRSADGHIWAVTNGRGVLEFDCSA